jgi:3alpha(or 20beta)-hydroxysteroid dehydrogenase
MIDFTDQTVVVTGGARGQGEAECRLFASLGARVVVADVDLDPAIAVARSIGDRALAIRLDVADAKSWHDLLKQSCDAFGGVDVLVNNAGIFRSGRIDQTSMDAVDAMIAINQRGTYLGVSVIGSYMYAGRGGAIVNVASVAAVSPGEGSTIYGMTKGAVVTLTRGAAVEFGPKVRVNVVLPGGTATRMLSEGSPPFFDSVPMARVGEPQDIAHAVAFLASSAAAYCTGVVLPVDGGWQLGPNAKTFGNIAHAAIADRSAAA